MTRTMAPADKVQNARQAVAAVQKVNGTTFPAALKALDLLREALPQPRFLDEAVLARPTMQELKKIAEELKRPVMRKIVEKNFPAEGSETLLKIDDFIRNLEPIWQGH